LILDGGEWSACTLVTLFLEETAHFTHWIGGWVTQSQSWCNG